jgi:hypothetical protein
VSGNSDNNNRRRRVVVVTGSGKGIGKAIAMEFAKAGYYVMINDFEEEEELKRTAEEISKTVGNDKENNNKIARPSLSLNRQDFPRVVRIEIPLYTLNIPDFPRELSQVKVPYIVNSVVIKNKDNSAAENCKGILGINDLLEKICWYISSERYTMTINSHSEEYLDVCAILDVEPQLVYDRLDEHVSQRFGSRRPGSEARAYVKAIYNRSADIPVIIAPIENGWMDAHLNRRIQPGDATFLITSKNAKKTLKQDIRILATPNVEGKIIEWR